MLDVCGLRVSPGDPQALADAIRALAEDPVRRKNLGSAGRAYAEGTLDKGVILTDLLVELQQLLRPECPA